MTVLTVDEIDDRIKNRGYNLDEYLEILRPENIDLSGVVVRDAVVAMTGRISKLDDEISDLHLMLEDQGLREDEIKDAEESLDFLKKKRKATQRARSYYDAVGRDLNKAKIGSRGALLSAIFELTSLLDEHDIEIPHITLRSDGYTVLDYYEDELDERGE